MRIICSYIDENKYPRKHHTSAWAYLEGGKRSIAPTGLFPPPKKIPDLPPPPTFISE